MSDYYHPAKTQVIHCSRARMQERIELMFYAGDNEEIKNRDVTRFSDQARADYKLQLEAWGQWVVTYTKIEFPGTDKPPLVFMDAKRTNRTDLPANPVMFVHDESLDKENVHVD